MENQLSQIPPRRRRTFGQEAVEPRSAQEARDIAKNKALPLSTADREEFKKLADQLESEGR